MKKRSLFIICLISFMSLFAGASGYYTEPQVYNMRPHPEYEWNMGPIGPTGIFARIYKGMRVTVEKIEPSTPADGKFEKGDLLLGVNGTAHKGKNPLVVFGTAITEAEATDGVMTFDVQKAGSTKTSKVTIRILSHRGFRLFLNGHHIYKGDDRAGFSEYRSIELNKNMMKHLKRGKNTLATLGVVGYERDGKTGTFNPIGQIDMWLEGMKKEAVGLE